VPATNNAQEGQSPQSAREEQKIEVVLEGCDGAERVALKYSTWVDGLGWCVQKTIRVDGDQLDDLQRSLTVARHRIRRRRAEAGGAVRPAQVIQLPVLS
jgi:hypothetical protein